AAVAVKAAYGAELLAKANYDASPAAASQGRHVGAIVVGCTVVAAAWRWLALRFDDRLQEIEIPRWGRPALVAGVLGVLVAGGRAVGAPHRIADARKTFSRGQYYAGTADLRDRLTSAVDNGRIDDWRVALDGFDEQPAHGTGAGTYRLTWERLRPPP